MFGCEEPIAWAFSNPPNERLQGLARVQSDGGMQRGSGLLLAYLQALADPA